MQRFVLPYIISLSFTSILFGQDVIVKKNANTDPVIEINSAGNNSFIGKESGLNNTGTYNISLGYHSLFSNITGTRNVTLGANSLQTNTSGMRNVAVGDSAMYSGNTSFNTI